jgi:hypothetical protein
MRLGDEMREQVTEIIDRQAKEPFGVYVSADPDPAAGLARHVERVVFDESFGNSPEQLDREYGKYEAASVFLCVVDHEQRLPVGMARTILPSAVGLKSLNDLEREWGEDVDDVLTRTGLPVQQDRMLDCATIATLPEYRGGETHGVIGMALYQTLATGGIRCGFRWLVAVIDVPVLRVIQWRLGRPFQPYEGVPAMPYLGSTASIPVWTDLPVWSARLASSNPVKYDIACGGHGIEGVVAPPDWDRVNELVGGATERRLLTPPAPPVAPPLPA